MSLYTVGCALGHLKKKVGDRPFHSHFHFQGEAFFHFGVEYRMFHSFMSSRLRYFNFYND
jgi:hypothetical protein